MSISEKGHGAVASMSQNDVDEPQSKKDCHAPEGLESSSSDPWHCVETNQLPNDCEDERGEEEGEGEGEEEGEGEVGGVLMPAMRGRDERFSFTMCNPPFFESLGEASTNPNTACGGTEMEVACPGGELAFIMSMVEDSVRLGARVHWYSSMVGKKSTLKALRKELHSRHVTAIRTTEFAQGKTSRWAIAWSFEVDPAIASLPLPRALNPHLAPQPVPKRLVSFALHSHAQHSLHQGLAGGYHEGRKLLQAMEAVLSCHGAVRVKVDHSTWVVAAILPLSSTDKHQSALTSMGNDREAARQGEEKDVGGVVASKVEEADGAAFTLGSSIGGGRRGKGGEKVVHKRQRPGGKQNLPEPSAPVQLQGAATDSASEEGIAIRINIYAQQRDKYDVISSIGKQVDDAGTLRFMALMKKVEEDLIAMMS